MTEISSQEIPNPLETVSGALRNRNVDTFRGAAKPAEEPETLRKALDRRLGS